MSENYNIESEEEENEDDLTQVTDSFYEAVTWGTDWTTETLINQLKRKNIDLFPKFQRRDAWSKAAKSKFIESLILGLPIPQIILAEKKDKRGSYIIIDGKQRLLTIRQFFSETEDDEFKSLKLSRLGVLSNLNGKTIKHLEKDPDYNEYYTQLLNQSIRTVVIKNWPNEAFLFTVFLRLNTGSIKLSPQELRQALHPGEFIDFADTFSIESNSIKKMLGLKEPDYRMRDVEIVIRFFSNKYFITSYNGNLKIAFDDTVKKLNGEWEDWKGRIMEDASNLEKAIEFTMELFGEREAFSKWTGEQFQKNFNRAIFDIMIYYFSDVTILEESRKYNQEIVKAFKELCENDSEFLSSFEHTTKSVQNTEKRLSTWGDKLSEVIKLGIKVPYLNNAYSVDDNTSKRFVLKTIKK